MALQRMAPAFRRYTRSLRAADAGGDPKVHLGLLRAWGDRQYWPEGVQSQFSDFYVVGISKFIAAAYRKQHYGEIVWVKDLDVFTLEEKERLSLASVDPYFKIASVLDHDPSGDAALSLTARVIHEKVRNLSNTAAMEFMLKAISRPMHTQTPTQVNPSEVLPYGTSSITTSAEITRARQRFCIN
jgi:hypothetical protein